jgi:uncharacterized protein (TIGR03382 family)
MLVWGLVLGMAGAAGAEEVCMNGVAPGVNWCAYGDGNLQEEIHWATVDLTVPEVYIRVTRDDEGPVTTSQEATNTASSVTINGDWDDTNYQGPHGLSVGNAWYFEGSQDWDNDNPAGDWSFLSCTADKQCRMNPVNVLEEWTWNEINVIGGNGQRLVIDGVLQSPNYDNCTRPRSGVCLDITGEVMTFFVAEGDGDCASDTGWTPSDFAQFVFDHGCYNGLMLDGGGSSDLVINQVHVTDRPPGEPAERSTHNHLSVIHHQGGVDPLCTNLMNGRRCDGDTLVTCQGGSADLGDCPFFGATCEEAQGTAYCVHEALCPHGANADACQDDSVMIRCSLGQPTEFDCGSIFGASCEDTPGSARCIQVGCVNGGDTSWCDGDTLKTCAPDMLEDLNISFLTEVDCAASGQTCGAGACVTGDSDGDGVPDADDCAPDNNAIYPGATETCNGLDDDCDGDTDDEPSDAQTFFLDIDGDGYGNPNEKLVACDQPPAYSDNGLDCNDTDYETNPGKDETCNLSDDDCDDVIDEDAANTQTLYLDVDGDGFGNPNQSQLGCFAGDGWVTDNTDCNDTLATTYPGATEVCNTMDDDCDGESDEMASDAQTFYLDIDGDGYGNPNEKTVACDQPPAYSDNSLDCNDTDYETNPGKDETCNLSDDDCDDAIDEDATNTQTLYLDVDGDGYGNPNQSQLGCFAGDGWVTDNTDCNDTDPQTHPDAVEIPDDGTDQDCDGQDATSETQPDAGSTDPDAASAEPDAEEADTGPETDAATTPEPDTGTTPEPDTGTTPQPDTGEASGDSGAGSGGGPDTTSYPGGGEIPSESGGGSSGGGGCHASHEAGGSPLAVLLLLLLSAATLRRRRPELKRAGGPRG